MNKIKAVRMDLNLPVEIQGIKLQCLVNLGSGEHRDSGFEVAGRVKVAGLGNRETERQSLTKSQLVSPNHQGWQATNKVKGGEWRWSVEPLRNIIDSDREVQIFILRV